MNTEKQFPLVTVLMPVYNAEKYLHEAIDSILNQTYSQFDFMIINDCSTDNSEQIILSYNDSRIKYAKNPVNLKMAETLNKGINLIETKYIVRMDADDISVNNRIEKLVEFMQHNQSVGVLSSSMQRFGKITSEWKYPQTDADIKAYLVFGASLAHAAAIIRTSVLKKNNIFYRSMNLYEDFDLWHRLKHFTQFANLPDVLYKYREAEMSMTTANEDTAMERRKPCYKWILNEFGIEPTDSELELHISITFKSLETNSNYVRNYKKWIDKLTKVNLTKQSVQQDLFNKHLQNFWYKLFFTLPETNYKSVFTYLLISKKISYNQFSYLIKFTLNKLIFRKK